MLQMSGEVHCLGCHKSIPRDTFIAHREGICKDTQVVSCDATKGKECDMDYRKLLSAAPAHDTDEFIEYLRANNRVVMENDVWLVIENYKYHTPEKPWYTAFYKPAAQHSALNALSWLGFAFMDWTWLKKSSDDQSVKRFHIHIHK